MLQGPRPAVATVDIEAPDQGTVCRIIGFRISGIGAYGLFGTGARGRSKIFRTWLIRHKTAGIGAEIRKRMKSLPSVMPAAHKGQDVEARRIMT